VLSQLAPVLVYCCLVICPLVAMKITLARRPIKTAAHSVRNTDLIGLCDAYNNDINVTEGSGISGGSRESSPCNGDNRKPDKLTGCTKVQCLHAGAVKILSMSPNTPTPSPVANGTRKRIDQISVNTDSLSTILCSLAVTEVY